MSKSRRTRIAALTTTTDPTTDTPVADIDAAAGARPAGRKATRSTTAGIAGGILVSAVGSTLLLAMPGALVGAANAAPTVTTHSVSPADQKATLAYWTPQRRAAAVSADVVNVSAPAPRAGVVRPDVPAGPAGQVGGRLPAAASTSPGVVASPASYPFPYSSGNVPANDYTKSPYLINGKIFFTNNGGNYVCSGTSVASYHGTSLEDEVWTAGHCVSNTSLKSPGVFDSFAEFIPAYNGTSKTDPEPFGIFTVSRYSVATNFLNNGDISVDEGAMEVGTNGNGQTLGQAVGWDGFRWNWSSTQNFTAFGYPAASPYTGNLMVKDTASTAASYTWPGGQGQPLIGIGNPMTGGSSGGAWDVDWSSSGSGYIEGHNDYKFGSQPNAVYSPYQDTLSNTVRCFGASSC